MFWNRILTRVVLTLVSAVECEAEVFDYIIVGAGTCGLTVANRLSENPKISVAIIEPGKDERGNPNVTNPAVWTQNFGTSVDWAYPSLAQLGGDNRTFSYHAGRGIGGV